MKNKFKQGDFIRETGCNSFKTVLFVGKTISGETVYMVDDIDKMYIMHKDVVESKVMSSVKETTVKQEYYYYLIHRYEYKHTNDKVYKSKEKLNVLDKVITQDGEGLIVSIVNGNYKEMLDLLDHQIRECSKLDGVYYKVSASDLMEMRTVEYNEDASIKKYKRVDVRNYVRLK